MAQPDILPGTYFSLMLGDGATPTENFTALCGITTRKFTSTTNVNERFTRDCNDPTDVPVRRLITSGKQWSLSGEGVLNRANLATIQAADDGLVHNWRYVFTEPADDLVFQGYYFGGGIMTSLEITGGDDEIATIAISIESDGQWDWQTV